MICVICGFGITIYDAQGGIEEKADRPFTHKACRDSFMRGHECDVPGNCSRKDLHEGESMVKIELEQDVEIQVTWKNGNIFPFNFRGTLHSIKNLCAKADEVEHWRQNGKADRDKLTALTAENARLCRLLDECQAANRAKEESPLTCALDKFLKSLKEEHAWQPIETAPLDRSLLLYHHRDGEFVGKWSPECERWVIACGDGFGAPSYWAPLPKPPK